MNYSSGYTECFLSDVRFIRVGHEPLHFFPTDAMHQSALKVRQNINKLKIFLIRFFENVFVNRKQKAGSSTFIKYLVRHAIRFLFCRNACEKYYFKIFIPF